MSNQEPDFSRFIGKTLGRDVSVEEIMQFSQAQSNRVLGLDSPMTMDYMPERVNIIKDENDKIVMINMG